MRGFVANPPPPPPPSLAHGPVPHASAQLIDGVTELHHLFSFP